MHYLMVRNINNRIITILQNRMVSDIHKMQSKLMFLRSLALYVVFIHTHFHIVIIVQIVFRGEWTQSSVFVNETLYVFFEVLIVLRWKVDVLHVLLDPEKL